MIYFKYLILILILIFCKNVLSQELNTGGTCEIIESNSPCYGKLNYTSFYLQKTETVTELNTNITKIFGLLELTTAQCKKPAVLLFCLKFFPKCNSFNQTDNTIINLPSLPCNDYCLETETPCQFYIQNYFKELSCSSTFSNGIPMFPNSSTSFNITDTSSGISSNITTECIGKSDVIEDGGFVGIQCPKPLLNAKDTVIDGKNLYYYITDDCILDCPFSIYPDKKMDRLEDANYVLTSISFITCTFMILTFGVLPNKLTHRMESILSFSIGGWINSLSLFVQSAQTNSNCSSDPGRYKSQSDYLCLFVGILFQFGALISIFWAPVIAYDFYLTSTMKKIQKFKIFRIVIWVFSVILTAIPAFGGKYGSTVATTGCWIVSDDNSAWQYVSFYIPSWISMGFICLFSILSVYNITKMYMQTPGNRRILFFNIKIIITLLILLFVLTFSSSLKFYLEERMNDFFESVALWSTCISTSLDPSSCELDAPGYDLKALNVVVISILGFTVFIGYGLDPIVIQIWKESKRLQWLINKLGLSNIIKLNSTISIGETPTTESDSSNHHHNHTKKQSKVKMSNINSTSPSSSPSSSSLSLSVNNNNNNQEINK